MARTVKVSDFQRMMAAEQAADQAGASDVAARDPLSGELVDAAATNGALGFRQPVLTVAEQLQVLKLQDDIAGMPLGQIVGLVRLAVADKHVNATEAEIRAEAERRWLDGKIAERCPHGHESCDGRHDLADDPIEPKPEDQAERMAGRAEGAVSAMGRAQVVDVAPDGIVEAVRPAEMTPDRGDVTAHHTVGDDDLPFTEPSSIIPSQAKFGTAPYLAAPQIEEMADHLIETKAQLGDLTDLQIVYRWKAKGGSAKGWPRLAGIERVSGQTLAFIAGPAPDLLVWLAADTLRESAVTERQIEAILFDQLVSVEWSDGDEDGDPTWRLVGPEVMCHLATLEEYGAFTRKLESAKAAFIQPSLFEAANQTDERFTQEEAERVLALAAHAAAQIQEERSPDDDGLDAV